MNRAFFHDVPVYRLSRDRYYKEMDQYIEKSMYRDPQNPDTTMKEFHERKPEMKIQFREHLRNSYGGAWNYNEIIGYIRLYFLGSQIRGEYWETKTKRKVRSRKKVFPLCQDRCPVF